MHEEQSARLRVLLSMVIYGTIGVFVRHIPLPASVIAMMRGAIGTPFLLLVLLLSRSRLNWSEIRRNLPRLILTGVVLGAPQTYRYFEQMQERIVGFLTAHSAISREQLLGYMLATDALANDMGTVLTGDACVECGLIDALGGLSDALAWLHGEIRRRRQEE